MSTTSIEWAHEVWNPVRGCSHISPGCANCYAEAAAGSAFTGLSKPGRPYYGLVDTRANGRARWTGDVVFDPAVLERMLRRRPYEVCSTCGQHRPVASGLLCGCGCADRTTGWERPRIFVNSMSDLFHDRISNEQIAAVFGVVASQRWADFLILTKRADRLRDWFDWAELDRGASSALWCRNVAHSIVGDMPRQSAADLETWPLPNLWLGVSVEAQEYAWRLMELCTVPAAVHWASFEPLLGPVQVRKIELLAPVPPHGPGIYLDAPRGHVLGPDDMLPGRLSWAVIGGESNVAKGEAREMRASWAKALIEELRSADVPVYFKQWGDFAVNDVDLVSLRLGRGGRKVEAGPKWARVREMPRVGVWS